MFGRIFVSLAMKVPWIVKAHGIELLHGLVATPGRGGKVNKYTFFHYNLVKNHWL